MCPCKNFQDHGPIFNFYIKESNPNIPNDPSQTLGRKISVAYSNDFSNFAVDLPEQLVVMTMSFIKY